MNKEILSEINRYRELVGLPLMTEATMTTSPWAKLVELIDNIATDAKKAIIDLENQAAIYGDATAAPSYLNRLKTELEDVAELANVKNPSTLSAGDLVGLLKDSDNVAVRTELIRVLCDNLPEVQQKVATILKNDPRLLSAVETLDRASLETTLKRELGITNSYILDDLLNTLYKNVDANLSAKLVKVGLNWENTTTQTLRTEIINGLAKETSNIRVQRFAQYLQKHGSDLVTMAYDNAVKSIAKMPGGITIKNAETYFNNQFANIITQIKTEYPDIDKTLLQKFGSVMESIWKWSSNEKNILAAKTKGQRRWLRVFAIVRFYSMVFGIISLWSAGTVAIGRGYKVAFDKQSVLLDDFLSTPEGQKLFADAEENNDYTKFNERFERYKQPLLQAGIEFFATFFYPIKLGLEYLEILDVDGPPSKVFSKDEIKKKAEKIINKGKTVDKYENNVVSFKKWASEQNPVITVTTDPKVTTDAVTTLYDVNGFIYKWCAIKNTFFADDKYMNECK